MDEWASRMQTNEQIAQLQSRVEALENQLAKYQELFASLSDPKFQADMSYGSEMAPALRAISAFAMRLAEFGREL